MNTFFGTFCTLMCIGMFALAFYLLILLQQRKGAYHQTLDQLKQDPHNPALKQEAVRRGRAYASVAGRWKRNEVMLINDINAASAQAGSEVTIKGDKRQRPSIEERLEMLDDLRAKGLISDGEHMARRQRILDEI